MEPKILVVDDAIDSWQLLRTILRSNGYQPVWAVDAIHAISEARRHQPQAILLDLGLPDRDGFVVLERLKGNKRLSTIPVIVVTVRDPDVAEQKSRDYGAIAFLQKPVKPDQLIATIREALDQESVSSRQKGERMAGFFMRKAQRFKDLVPVQYRGDGIVGEGMLKNLSLSGGSITGNVPVPVGMALGLHMFVPGDPEPLQVDRAIVKWVKGREFGVELTLKRNVSERLTRLITEKVKKRPHSPSHRA